MARNSKITIRVTSNRSGTSVQFRTTGLYKSLTTAGYQRTITDLPLQNTTSLDTFWAGVLAAVQTSLTTDPTPP
jgi:hypothetical protein